MLTVLHYAHQVTMPTLPQPPLPVVGCLALVKPVSTTGSYKTRQRKHQLGLNRYCKMFACAEEGRFAEVLDYCLLQAVDFVRDRLLEGQSVKYISESVCDHCLAKDTGGIGIGCDNMSMMVVVFKRFTNFHKAQAARLDAMTSDLQS